ncbi:MAG TPA: acetylpolyamine aminohydrolase, partial [Gammaproteobacteria bacterium]|nr:acetylpolyamine aminohydrolase [Gammaproteobacteria bacterium]
NYPYLDAVSYPQGPHVHLRSLPAGVKGDGYLAVLGELVDRVRETGADVVVVSLGFDTVATDGIQDASVGLEIGHYRRIGERIAALELPTLVVVEGGYDLAALSDCARSFAEGLTS